jgi:hypothetical protein
MPDQAVLGAVLTVAARAWRYLAGVLATDAPGVDAAAAASDGGIRLADEAGAARLTGAVATADVNGALGAAGTTTATTGASAAGRAVAAGAGAGGARAAGAAVATPLPNAATNRS